MVNGLSSMHKQEVLHGLNGWERKVVGEDKIRIGGEGIGWTWLKHIVSMYTILNKKIINVYLMGHPKTGISDCF